MYFMYLNRELKLFMLCYLDVYSFIIGSCIIRAVVIGAKHAVQHVQTRGVVVLLSQTWQWFITTFKSFAVVLLWVRNQITF